MSIGRYVVSRPIPPSYLLGFGGGRFMPDPFKTHAIIFFIPSSSNRTFSHFRPTTLGSQFRGSQTHTLFRLFFFDNSIRSKKNWRSFHFFIICLWFWLPRLETTTSCINQFHFNNPFCIAMPFPFSYAESSSCTSHYHTPPQSLELT